MVGGRRTGQLCVTVFVRRKVSAGVLKREHHVPRFVRRHGMNLPTDVVAIGRICRQGGFPINAEGKKGTLGAWGLSQAGSFGITCAHCLPPTGDAVTGEFPAAGDYLELGVSDGSADESGSGVFPSYGDFDAGLIRLTTPSVQRYAASQPVQCVYRPPAAVTPSELRDLLQFLPVAG